MAELRTTVEHRIKLEESEYFDAQLNTGKTRVDNIMVQGGEDSARVGGFAYKADGTVGRQRRAGMLPIDALPDALVDLLPE
jgi:hypothetical protein